MNSFLDEPRTMPKPAPLIQRIETPTVPEVSLMFQNSKKNRSPVVNIENNRQSYNAWRLRSVENNIQDSLLLTSPSYKENIQEKNYVLKKQVRFQNPTHNCSSSNVTANKGLRHLLPSTNFKNLENSTETRSTGSLTKSTTDRYHDINVQKLSTNPVFQFSSDDTLKRLETMGMESNQGINANKFLNFKPTSTATSCNTEPNTNQFEKIYCSGIPLANKELDLSFLEPHKNSCPRQMYAQVIEKSPTVSAANYVPYYRTNPILVNRYEKHQPSAFVSKDPRQCNQTSNSSPVVEIPTNTEKVNSVCSKATETSLNIVENETESKCDNYNKNQEKSPSQTEETVEADKNDNPSVQDLLKIIKLQNEQLERLQNQVEILVKLSENNQTKKVENESSNNNNSNNNNNIIFYKDQQVGTSFNDDFVENHVETSEEIVEDSNKKISVGMMTSFEVSFKPPANNRKLKNKQKPRQMTPVDTCSTSGTFDYVNKPQKKRRDKQHQEYVKQRNDGKRKNVKCASNANYQNRWANKQVDETEYSLGSQESLEIHEPQESPENSIHIDLQEYSTDSETSSSEDSDDECSSDAGWTFYKDILGQVNNLLENSNRPGPKQNKYQNNPKRGGSDTVLQQIKQNALQRLKNDGFLDSGNEYAFQPNEISFAVKQVLMKYMPNDGLAEAAMATAKQQERCKTEKRRPTDVSVAAVKYMQQCNLVTNGPPCYGTNGKPHKNSKQNMYHPSMNPKILDITTLKKQPKLL